MSTLFDCPDRPVHENLPKIAPNPPKFPKLSPIRALFPPKNEINPPIPALHLSPEMTHTRWTLTLLLAAVAAPAQTIKPDDSADRMDAQILLMRKETRDQKKEIAAANLP